VLPAGACKTVSVLQVSCPSVVGRIDETAALEAALDEAIAGAGSFVWVAGEAGVGKSRVVRDFCDIAAGRGLPVLVGRAVDTGTPVPFRPLFEALSGHVRRLGANGRPPADRRALAQIVPEWRSVEEETYPASAMEIGEGLLRFLASIAGDACVLVLEDLHWADPDTAAVVEYVADNLRATPVLCVVTTRLEGSDHVGRVLSDLAARRSATRIELRRLTTDELGTMVSMCLGGEVVNASVMSLIGDFADGLPFLVEELLTTSVADGTITSSADGWRVEAAGVPAVPERFAELVRRRMGSLDDGAARVIRVGAVLGQRFDTEVLRVAVEAPIETVAQALRAGVRAQLVTADRSDSTAFEFRHALTREAILDELLPLERIEIAREAMAALERGRPDLGDSFGEQAAALAEVAGETERAAGLLLQAARRARQRGALSSAVPMLGRAWSFVNEPEPEWFEIGEALLSVLATTGAVDEALAVGEQMLAVAGLERRATIHLAMARAAAEASRWDTAGGHATAAHGLVEKPGSLIAARVDAVNAEVAVGQGRFIDAELLARNAMKIADQHQDNGLRAATALVIGRCERGRGEGNPAATFDSVVRIGREHGLPNWQLRGLMERSSLALWEYEPPRGILAAREHALNAGALVVVAHLDNFLAWQAHDRRNTDQIEPAARRCIDLAERLRLPTLHGVATVALAVAAAHQGDSERLDRLLAEADAIAGGHADVVALGGVARATQWIDRDDLRRAGTALAQMMQQLRVTPAVACPERGVWVLFQALDGDEAGAAAIDELDAYVGPNHVMIDSYRSYARAVVSGRRGARDDANRHVALAERVQPTPWFQHHARRLVAETAHADGWGDPITWLRDAHSYFETRGDDRLASSCRSLLGTLGSALPRQRRSDERVPPRLRALGVSAREADVLELLADARSTRSIAETLHVSPKTVERHIANLATKLGVEGRTAVVAYAARSALDPVD
jgi:DNA-binding CsgD family transcriptional regulator